MPLPDFLIVGAQRSGTSTLYEDLLDVPGVYLPAVKEPYNLTDDHVLTPRGRARYATLFQPGRDAARCGEASTRYTMRPHYERCAKRALQVLGPDARIIYIIREPIARAVSHHRFDYANGWVSADPDAELPRHARYINAGRYAFQITPWIDAFGRERVHFELFDDLPRDRRGVIARICRFLGVGPPPPPKDRPPVNASAALPPLRGPAARVAVSGLYQRRVRALIPRRARAWVRRRALPDPRPVPPPPGEPTARFLAERLAPEVEQISRIIGAPGPLWDLEAVAAGYRHGGDGAGRTRGP